MTFQMFKNNKLYLVSILIVIIVTSCATSREVRLAEQLSKAGNWDAAALAYQEAIKRTRRIGS